MGIATAGVGALGAYGQYQSQQDAARAANQGRINNYKYQLQVRENNWMRAKSDWENDKINYEETVADNSFAAQEGYARAQRQLNEQFKAAAFSEQGDMIKLLESQGQMAASGRAGKSAQRLDDSMVAAWGRNNATKAASLASSKEGYQQQVEDIWRQQRDANESAFDEVAFAPQPDMAPQKPMMEKGPSKLGLVTGIAQAGMGGFSTYQSLKAPTAFTPQNNSLKIPRMSPTGNIDWASNNSQLVTGW